MPTTVTVTTREGEQVHLAGPEGQSLMEVLRDAEIDDEIGLCGGCCSCATCHVWIDTAASDDLPLMSDDEDGMLSSLDSRKDCSRLGCQIPLGGDVLTVAVSMPPEP